MHMAGFKQAVKKLAKGKHHTAKHGITEYVTGETTDVWECYIDGTEWINKDTPEEALEELAKQCSALK